MSPQQIFDYKRKWLMSQNNHIAFIHIDVSDKCIEWCKENLNKESWDFKKWLEVYHHAILFEKETDLANFQDSHTQYCENTIYYV